MYKISLFLVFLCIPLPGLTQTPSSSTASIASSPASYADEAAVVERDDMVYRYAMDGTGTRMETSVLRVQSSAAVQSLAVLSFPYVSGNQTLEIVYARVRKADGSVVETPSGDAQDQPAPVTQVAPMYSDLHIRQIPVRSLAVGDKLEFQIRVTQQKPDVPDHFWGQESFGSGMVFLERSVELDVPKKKQVNVYSPDHTPEISESGEERIYRWHGSQLRATSSKPDETTPEVKTAPIAWTTYPSWEAVGAWYRDLIAGRDAVTPAIQAKADELTVNAKSNEDKVRALYEYVSTRNHYIGIDFGVGRYQPHFAAEVMTNQYGDCKDKHTLLAALLKAKGFSVSAVLIGMGIEMNEKVPMPAAFNHLITQVDVDGQQVWLDTTTEVAPYRVLLALLRDKNALVIPEKGGPSLQKTPAQLPFPVVTRYEATSELEKSGALKGKIEISMRGDDEILMRLAARQVARSQWDQLSQSYSSALGFDGTTSGTALDPAEGTSGPWHLRYEYGKSPYGDWSHFRIGSLLPNVELPTVDDKKPPLKDLELGTPRSSVAHSVIHLPEGYSADLPDAVHLKNAFASFDKTYELKDGSLVSESRLELLKAKVPATDWKEYKKFVDGVGVEPWIQLTVKERAVGEKGPPLAGEDNPVAAELVRQVHSAIVAKDYELAQKKSDQAVAVNDRQSYAWSQRGYLAGLRHDYEESATDYERELMQHPENIDQYMGLISAERSAKRTTKLREALLAYAKADPKKDSVVLYVGASLYAIDDVGDAVDVYRAGARNIPENRLVRVELAMALFRAGKSDEAIALVKAALDGSSDPEVLILGARILIKNNTDLALAESSSRKAVDLLEAETTQTPLDGVNDGSFHRAGVLLIGWDTLGWTYLAEGKNDLAEQYLRASWKNGIQEEFGLHLGQLLEKRGAKEQAMQTYEMAMRGGKGIDAAHTTAELHEKIDALKKQGVHAQYPDAESVLQNQRKYHVPRPPGVTGLGIFRLQVSAMKTERIEFFSGKEALRVQAEVLSHLDLGLEIPKDSHVLLLRSGVLLCSTTPTCEFVLMPPETANAN